ncbi:MAG: radical SAM protein [Promethearchaeota archaeon]|nr:MAG: radical SAM protein [Candidatus Lokiarchaeota archaeon]
MNNIKNKYEKWNDFKAVLDDNSNNIEPFLSNAQKIKKANFGNLIRVYIPGTKFPAISITGDKCELNCEHCNRKYLRGMKPVLSEKELEKFLIEHYNEGGVGALISGGSLADGSVPLNKYLDSIQKVKEETELIINTHTGLLNDEETAKKLAKAGVDIISFDINMDQQIIKDIYHLNKNLKDYKKAIDLLKQYKLNIVPHVCIGLYYGSIHKELESLKFIKKSNINPSLIVLIALIPPNKSNNKFKTPSPRDIAKVIGITRMMFPNTEISLGCMRPRKKARYSIEMNALKAGVNRIEMPLRKTLNEFKKKNPNAEFQFFSACCAVPVKFEDQIKMNKAEIKQRYKNLN